MSPKVVEPRKCWETLICVIKKFSVDFTSGKKRLYNIAYDLLASKYISIKFLHDFLGLDKGKSFCCNNMV
jgi:hypothetical protein